MKQNGLWRRVDKCGLCGLNHASFLHNNYSCFGSLCCGGGGVEEEETYPTATRITTTTTHPVEKLRIPVLVVLLLFIIIRLAGREIERVSLPYLQQKQQTNGTSKPTTTSRMNQHRMTLFVLGGCIALIVVLNLSYVPGPVRNPSSFDKRTSSRSSSNKDPKPTRQGGGSNSINDDLNNSNNNNNNKDHRLGGLNCDRFNGPSEDIASEMVYWSDIPDDSKFISPYANVGPQKKYLTFEPDEGGWNNIRMSMETATALAHAMGRILVLPPEQRIYLLDKDKKENNQFTFHSFFHFDSIAKEHLGVDVISMEDFLQEVMAGNIKDQFGTIALPPKNRTQWGGLGHIREGGPFYQWLRNVTIAPIWDFSKCVVGFASQPGIEGFHTMEKLNKRIETWENLGDVTTYINKPTPVDAKPDDRLKEMLAHRKKMCIYDDTMQQSKVMHFMGDNDSGARLLVHFYVYMFFEDWKQDLWTKRYVRDHLRYVDEIQCAAATIVHAVREIAKQNGDPNGLYDSFHIRRGDFQYKQTRIGADEIYDNVKDVLIEQSTIFIATDEKNSTFFQPLKDHYKVYFLSDFLHLVPNLNKNYFGMLDQLIASRGRTFVGAYFSTFTGYINRMRGYHSQKDKLPGYEMGKINSYFYAEKRHKEEMVNFFPIKGPLWSREFPVGWRDIDHDVDPAHIVSSE
jgi:hypothetical protein